MTDQQVITVTGEGVVQVVPDRAQLILGVVTEDTTVSNAQQKNNELITEIILALNTLGIPEDQIKTVTYRIEPKYDFIDGQQQFRAYEVTHMVQVVVEDLTQTGAVVDVAVENGANMVTSIQFTVADPTNLYREALQLALEDARGKANAMTNTLNVSLVETPVKVIERSVGGPVRFYDGAMLSSAATPIQPGSISIQASVEVIYSFQ
ncbi:SIMPL domain-containing protein [Alkalihalophilus lindianensis]|uniref:SIMPL domain-containing protein n=1 Tax=Alkalihalophilus lindianensis TaxID=1630542 RepID=A0ABU3X7V1_9BACI|nr:SIMPL domain-containing protein [Alkalihalophilus lindianensis]MDV2683358.1 SIMPL domain-containing protein [Alkalihalophilus lindianensis]